MKKKTFVGYLKDETLKAELRFHSRKALLLLHEGVNFIEEFVPSAFAMVAGTWELCRHSIEYL